MALENELIAIEESLWTGGPDSYTRHLDAECLVAFTEMAGVSSREQVAGTVSEAERWRKLKTEVQGILRPTPEIALLTYRASAVQGEGERYEALVSSGYVRRGDAWKLVFHQQTPLSS